MPSPFPGMDPYLEPHWLDVHARLVTYSADSLNRLLPADLVASTEERVAVEDPDEVRRHVFGPDVRVTESPFRSIRTGEVAVQSSASAGVATLPYRLTVEIEPIVERFIQIIEPKSHRLITVIELLSPTNKREPGLVAFQEKRQELVGAGVNFVEIDLIRAGDWRKLLAPFGPGVHTSLYRVSIRLPHERGVVQFQPIALREKLPKIPIPLRKTDPSCWLDLQSLLDQAYDNGRYAQRLNYSQPPEPPLGAEDAQWAATLLSESVSVR